MDEIDERNTETRHESGWAAFMRVMRYVSVGVITLALFVIMLFSMTDDGKPMGVSICYDGAGLKDVGLKPFAGRTMYHMQML